MDSNRPQQILGLICVCCGQMYFPTTAMRDALENVIFGSDRYVECAVCGLNVPDDLRDSRYEKRWRRAMRVHLQREELRLLVALSLITEINSTGEADALFDFILRKVQIYYPSKSLPEMIESGDRLRKILRK